jgi:hypothetical protein
MFDSENQANSVLCKVPECQSLALDNSQRPAKDQRVIKSRTSNLRATAYGIMAGSLGVVRLPPSIDGFPLSVIGLLSTAARGLRNSMSLRYQDFGSQMKNLPHWAVAAECHRVAEHHRFVVVDCQQPCGTACH